MSNVLTILVTGSTGQQGGSVARALMEQGHHVRGLTRNTESRSAQALAAEGASLVQGDMTDPASLAAALQDVDGVFVMGTPFEGGIDAEIAHGKTMVDAAADAGVAHVVYSSVASADQNTAVPHFDSKYEVEQYLRGRDVPHTVIAPVFFMENLFLPDTLGGIREGVYASPLKPDTKLQQISLADIGSFAAWVFTHRSDFLGQRVELAAGALSGNHVATALGVVAGRPIEYRQMPMEQIRSFSEDLALMYEYFERVGYQVDIGELRSRYPDVGWHGYADFLAAQDADTFRKAS
jgi:uncharacterized protein YbjT (DUF2867 family)